MDAVVTQQIKAVFGRRCPAGAEAGCLLLQVCVCVRVHAHTDVQIRVTEAVGEPDPGESHRSQALAVQVTPGCSA